MSNNGRDSLLLAMTRPAVVAGIPLEAFATIIVVSIVAWAMVSNMFIAMGIAAPSYLISRIIVAYDINAFRLIGLYMRTKFSPNASISLGKFWGGNTYSPTANHGASRKGFGSVETWN